MAWRHRLMYGSAGAVAVVVLGLLAPSGPGAPTIEQQRFGAMDLTNCEHIAAALMSFDDGQIREKLQEAAALNECRP